MAYALVVNGKSLRADVDADTPLLWVLRDTLGLTGTKFGCGVALCGACTVHVGGEARRSCVTPVAMVGPGKIRTIEALGESPVGRALQRAWLNWRSCSAAIASRGS
jgi:isoquinoline 1-oxidoreductase alpha subunit